MKISELIEMLTDFLEEEGDMEVFIYDSHGDKIDPRSINVGSVCRSRDIEDYAYITDLS